MKFYFLLAFSALLCLSACKQQQPNLNRIEGKQIAIADTLSQNAAIDSFVKPYAEHIHAEMNTALAYAPKSLDKFNGEFNTAIGNMMADAVLEMVNPFFEKNMHDSLDAVLLNYGGIRSTINAGDVTTGTAYDIMPFENEVVVVALKKPALQAMFAFLAKHKIAHPMAGMQLILDEKGQIESEKVQGAALKDDKIYYVATNNYLQTGGDHMDFLSETDTVINMNYKLRNIFIDYFKKIDTLAPVRDDRFMQK